MKDKTALITGGSRGIGLAIAHKLAQRGCKIIICARDVRRLYEVYYDMRVYGQEIKAIKCDVLNDDDIRNVMDQIGELDILVNNVGGGGRWGDTIVNTPTCIWQEVYQMNAGAATLFTQGAIPLMLKQNWGRVISITSIYGKEGGGKPWFTMAKAAEHALMKCCANEFGNNGVTFNSIAAGVIDVEGKELDRSGTVGTTEDVANAVAFLCSDEAKHINGAQIVVDGGQTRSF